MRIGMKVLGIIEANAFIGEESGLLMPTLYSQVRTRADLAALIEKECGVEELIKCLEKIAEKRWIGEASQRMAKECLSKLKGEL